MDPVSTTLFSAAKNAATQYIGGLIKSKVIERWSQYRAEKFYESFLDEFQKQADVRYQSADLDDLLRKLSEDDEVTSTLFDAYRRVCLSASRELGPRIIGLLTAEIVLEGRSASEGEERMFQAAETLNDSDLLEFAWYIQDHVGRLDSEKRAAFDVLGHTKILLRDETVNAAANGGYLRPSPPLEISSDVGIWALRLKNICLIEEERMHDIWVIREDSERHIDEDTRVCRTTDYLLTTRECHRLAALVERAAQVPQHPSR